MIVKTGQIKLFWLFGNENKPSKELFNSLISNMTEQDIKVQYIDNRTIQVVIKDKNINYISINHKDKIQYYFFNKIIKELNDAYLCEFILDLYTSYTLPMFDAIKDKEVKVVRSHMLTDQASQYDDKLLSSIDIISEGQEIYQDTVDEFHYDSSSRLWKNRDDTIRLSDSTIDQGTIHYVFNFNQQDLGLTYPLSSYAFFPLMFTLSETSQIKINNSYINCSNNSDLDRLVWKYSSKFIGLFVLPSAYTIPKNNFKILKVNDPNNPQLHNKSFAYYESNFTTGRDISTIEGITLDSSKFIPFNVRPNLNQSDKLHSLAAKYIDLNYYGNKVNATDLLVGINQAIFNFSMSGFYAWKNKYNNMEDNILKLPDNLPVAIDEFKKYVDATRNQRDTGLSVAKQNAVFGGITSGISGILGGIGGGGLGAISSLFGIGSSIANSVIGYQQKQALTNAQLEDARSTKGTSVDFSCNKEFVLLNNQRWKYKEEINPNRFKIKGLGCYYKKLSLSSIKSLNNVIYWYGTYNPLIKPLNQFLNINNDFNYLQLDIGYFINIISTNPYWLTIPVEFYNEITSIISNGIRIWKQLPN